MAQTATFNETNISCYIYFIRVLLFRYCQMPTIQNLHFVIRGLGVATHLTSSCVRHVAIPNFRKLKYARMDNDTMSIPNVKIGQKL